MKNYYFPEDKPKKKNKNKKDHPWHLPISIKHAQKIKLKKSGIYDSEA